MASRPSSLRRSKKPAVRRVGAVTGSRETPLECRRPTARPLELGAVLWRRRRVGVAPRQRPALGVGVAEEEAGVLQHREERGGVQRSVAARRRRSASARRRCASAAGTPAKGDSSTRIRRVSSSGWASAPRASIAKRTISDDAKLGDAPTSCGMPAARSASSNWRPWRRTLRRMMAMSPER